jgi:ATP-dependent protease HslVU (ClpYQ) peptidase subunit
MTCIIGMLDKENDCAWIGGDSLGSNWANKSVYLQPKVFRNSIFKNVIMGSTTTFRHIDLLKYSENLFPEVDFYKKVELDHKYMVTKFIPNLITLFDNGIKSEVDRNKGASFIVCAGNRVFEIQGDYSVLEPAFGFCSVGCGQDFALGSLYSTRALDITPKERIALALEAAEQCGCGVQRPFTILNTKDEEVITIT